MPTFTPEQHAVEVNKELVDCVQKLNKKSRRKLLKSMAVAIKKLTNNEQDPRRVTSEGDCAQQRVGAAPPVTTTTDPTAPENVYAAPRSHSRTTRANVPGATPAINRPAEPRRRSPRLNLDHGGWEYATLPCTPNSDRIPLAGPSLVSQEALNLLTSKVWDAPDDTWTPRDILEASPTERPTAGTNVHDVNIEHFCAAVVHPDTGETITKYKKLATDSNKELRETWQTAMGKEVGNLAQGDDKPNTPGKNCMFVMTHE